jgi:glycosyltransferase involved in cell wall biosynthesis
VRVLLWYWGKRGGGAQFTASLAEALGRHAETEVFSSVSTSLECISRVRQASVKSSESRLHPPVGLISAAHSLRGFDVILHTMINPLTPAGFLFCGKTPVATVIHDGRSHLGENDRVMQAARRSAIRRSSALIAPSVHVQSQIHTQLKELTRTKTSCDVIPLGPHLSLPNLFDPDGSVVFFGRFSPYKGLQNLAEFWERSAFRESVTLKVIGFGPDGEVEGLRRSGALVSNRWVHDDEVADVLQGTRLIVLPYLEASQSGVITLAQSAGIPILSTDVGGLPEQLAVGGLSVSISDFEEALSLLLRNPSMLAKLHLELQDRASDDRIWDQYANEFVNVFRRML